MLSQPLELSAVPSNKRFFSPAFLHFSPTDVYFLQATSIFLQHFLSSVVRSAFLTPHTRTPFRAVQTYKRSYLPAHTSPPPPMPPSPPGQPGPPPGPVRPATHPAPPCPPPTPPGPPSPALSATLTLPGPARPATPSPPWPTLARAHHHPPKSLAATGRACSRAAWGLREGAAAARGQRGSCASAACSCVRAARRRRCGGVVTFYKVKWRGRRGSGGEKA